MGGTYYLQKFNGIKIITIKMIPANLLHGTTVIQELSLINFEYAHWQSIQDIGRNIALLHS